MPNPFLSRFCDLRLVCWTLWCSLSYCPLEIFTLGWSVACEKKDMSGHKRRTSLSIWSKTSLSLKKDCHWLFGLGFKGWSSHCLDDCGSSTYSSKHLKNWIYYWFLPTLLAFCGNPYLSVVRTVVFGYAKSLAIEIVPVVSNSREVSRTKPGGLCPQARLQSTNDASCQCQCSAHSMHYQMLLIWKFEAILRNSKFMFTLHYEPRFKCRRHCLNIGMMTWWQD